MPYEQIVRAVVAQAVVDLVREKKIKASSLASTAGAAALASYYVRDYIEKFMPASMDAMARDAIAELISLAVSKALFNLGMNYAGLSGLSDSSSTSVERQLMLAAQDSAAIVLADRAYTYITGQM